MEPGSAEDVGKIVSYPVPIHQLSLTFAFFAQLRVLGSCRTPFAVKGAGHSTNPGFSSTPGVLIALSRFNDIKVNAEDLTVEVGPGLTWDQVYKVLSPTGVNAIGGRIPGVGVAGLTLGGGESLGLTWTDSSQSQPFVGYSYKTSQYGLAIDNVAGYELVLPNGTIKNVTPEDEDLWFGLRVSK